MDSLSCWLSKVLLKRCILETGLTKSFTVCNFENKLTMTIIFISKCLKFNDGSRNWTKDLKNFFVFKIIAFESETAIYHSLEQDTCHWQSKSYETPLRFNILVREIFSKSGSLSMMKRLPCRFYKTLDAETWWLSKGVPKRCFLKSGLSMSFTVCNFQNKEAMKIIFFFKTFKIWCRFQKWNKKIRKSFSF